MKRTLIALASLLLSATTLQGQEPVRPGETPEDAFTLGYGKDGAERMTVPVNIEGRGPFRFVVDTGAERTVIARELASQLRLGDGKTTRLHSMTEVSNVRTVVIPALEVGGKRVKDIHAPALEQRHLGAAGILGVDTLQSQRVTFDFPRQQMTVSPSRRREESWASDAILVTARSRFGHLVLVDASIEGQKVWVILDTGAETTVGNSALRSRLERKRRLRATWPIEMISVTGGRLMAEQTVVKEIQLGEMNIHDMPIAFSDVHPFRKLDLMDRPALLLGMDALRIFERVSVDFANRKVRLLAPSQSRGPSPSRMAEKELSRPAG